MGGNALKAVNLRRVERVEFEEILGEVQAKLRTHFSQVVPLLFYKKKADFGDLDLIVPLTECGPQLRDFLFTIGATEVYKNDTTWSFDYREFQIDLIGTPVANWTTAAFYFSYNDLNNLVGRIAHKFGLKFGHEGLHYPVLEKAGNWSAKIEVTKEPAEIYAFLGLDYQRYLQGFDTVEDIFDFVLTSPYFDTQIYAYESLNHTNRTRNRKRKNYAGFLDYLVAKDIQQSYVFPSLEESQIIIEKSFPQANFMTKLKALRQEFQERKDLALKFNGHLVKELTHLEGNDLGLYIQGFKRYTTANGVTWEEYLKQTSVEQIKIDILYYFNLYE